MEKDKTFPNYAEVPRWILKLRNNANISDIAEVFNLLGIVIQGQDLYDKISKADGIILKEIK